MIAYIITNTTNGKRYVGITRRTLSERWREHLGYTRAPKNPLHFAMVKYGVDAFTIEHVASAKTWSDLQIIERILIEQECTFLDGGRGYNATSGGERLAGYYASEETRRKLAIAGTGRKHTLESIVKISSSRMGKPLSPGHRAAVSAAHKGNTYCLGRIMSEETKTKISAALIGKSVHSEETRKQMSITRKGKSLPPRSFTPKAIARRALAEARAQLATLQPSLGI